MSSKVSTEHNTPTVDPAPLPRADAHEKGINESKDTVVSSTQTSSTLVEDNDVCPDGGYGWICVVCSFVFHFFAIGIESTWGVYQQFIFDSQLFPSTNSKLAWVGSIQATGVAVIGLFAGLLAEKIGYKQTSFIGSTIMSVGFIVASFSTKLWHLYLTQGIIFGLGSGIAFIPAITILSQWFDKRRGLATGIAVSGSGIGGLVLSPLTQVFIDRVGFRWSLRITGLMCFGSLTIASIFLKTRGTRRRNATHRVDLTLIRDPIFLFLCAVGFFSGFGFYTPIFYVPDYATKKLGLTATQGATSAAIISGLSAVGRIILGYFGDTYGHLNTLVLCQGMGCVSQMAVWPFTTNAAGLMGFCAYFGFFSGGFVSVYPVVAAEIYGTDRIASIAGAMFSSYVPGTLTGTPIVGAIIDNHTSRTTGEIDFLPAALFGGAWMGASASMAFVVRCLRARALARENGSGLTLKATFLGRV